MKNRALNERIKMLLDDEIIKSILLNAEGIASSYIFGDAIYSKNIEDIEYVDIAITTPHPDTNDDVFLSVYKLVTTIMGGGATKGLNSGTRYKTGISPYGDTQFAVLSTRHALLEKHDVVYNIYFLVGDMRNAEILSNFLIPLSVKNSIEYVIFNKDGVSTSSRRENRINSINLTRHNWLSPQILLNLTYYHVYMSCKYNHRMADDRDGRHNRYRITGIPHISDIDSLISGSDNLMLYHPSNYLRKICDPRFFNRYSDYLHKLNVDHTITYLLRSMILDPSIGNLTAYKSISNMIKHMSNLKWIDNFKNCLYVDKSMLIPFIISSMFLRENINVPPKNSNTFIHIISDCGLINRTYFEKEDEAIRIRKAVAEYSRLKEVGKYSYGSFYGLFVDYRRIFQTTICPHMPGNASVMYSISKRYLEVVEEFIETSTKFTYLQDRLLNPVIFDPHFVEDIRIKKSITFFYDLDVFPTVLAILELEFIRASSLNYSMMDNFIIWFNIYIYLYIKKNKMVDGDYVIAQGVEQGKAVGDVLDALIVDYATDLLKMNSMDEVREFCRDKIVIIKSTMSKNNINTEDNGGKNDVSTGN